MNKLVVFDIDGVLVDFEWQLVKTLGREFGEIGYYNRDKFRLEDRFKDYPQILARALELTADPNFYYGLEPNEEALKFVKSLVEDGFPVMYVSSRPPSAENFTRRWLLKNVFGQVDVHCGVVDKTDFLSDLKDSIGTIVEDNPEQIENLKDAGFTVLCWGQPWNEGIFPRVYVRKDGVLMYWYDESKEAREF